jgi:hypothetical protein
MQWWNDLIDWTSSDDGWRVLSGAVIPFVAIIVAGVIAALIGRGATKRVVSLQEREAKTAAVSGVITAARKAATWGALGHEERGYADRLAEDADIRLRLLPVAGAPLAANWAQHEIADIKKSSSTFSFQADQSLSEFRDRILEWQARPGRAKKLFKSDLERWKFETPDPDADLVKRQQEWNADQVAARKVPQSSETPTPTTTSLRSAAPTPAPVPTPTPTPTSPSAAPADRDTTPADRDEPADAAATAPYGADATRPIGDGATRPYGEGLTTPIRPVLGSPMGGVGRAGSSGQDDDTDVVDDVRVDHPRAGDEQRAESGPTPDRQVEPDHHTGSNDVGRSPEAHRESGEGDEHTASPSANPVTASELRRRDDDD